MKRKKTPAQFIFHFLADFAEFHFDIFLCQLYIDFLFVLLVNIFSTLPLTPTHSPSTKVWQSTHSRKYSIQIERELHKFHRNESIAIHRYSRFLSKYVIPFQIAYFQTGIMKSTEKTSLSLFNSPKYSRAFHTINFLERRRFDERKILKIITYRFCCAKFEFKTKETKHAKKNRKTRDETNTRQISSLTCFFYVSRDVHVIYFIFCLFVAGKSNRNGMKLITKNRSIQWNVVCHSFLSFPPPI